MSAGGEETDDLDKITRQPIRNSVKRAYIEYVEQSGATAYKAWKHFRSANPKVNAGQVHRWLKKKDEITRRPNSMRSAGGGRKPLPQSME